MKTVTFKDENGKLRRALLKDSDSPDLAAKGVGIPQDPPDVELIDWNAVKVDLHNELVNRGLLTFQDVQRQPGDLTGAVRAALGRKVIQLYKGGL